MENLQTYQYQLKTIGILLLIIGVATLMRFLPHPPNFTPVLAIGLFAGASIRHPLLSLIIPLFVMLISDYFIGFHGLLGWVYGSIALSIFIGRFFNMNALFSSTLFSSLSSSALFFIITNFGVWVHSTQLYPKTVNGLVQCYVAAIPFFTNTLLSTLLYSFAIFSAYALIPNTQKSSAKL